jgi:hypothetical protein
VVINHAESINRYLEVKNRGENIGDALLDKTNVDNHQDLQKALKLVETRRKQEEKKVNERKRKESMSKEDKAEEQARLKKQRADNKQMKENKYQQALNLVNAYRV